VSDVLLSLVVPTWNGLAWLRRNAGAWRAALAAFERDVGPAELVIVDDGSTDGTRAWLAQQTDVGTVTLSRNTGFGAAANAGVDAARGRWVYLMNNDCAPADDGCFTALAPHMRAGGPFAVVSRSRVADGRTESVSALDVGPPLRLAQPGLEDPAFDAARPCLTFHAAGGFSLFDRTRFLGLGGFDPRFHPFYWEDVDLSTRAWRRGWTVRYEPASEVRHRGHGTIGALYRPEEVRRIQARGRALFALKHLGCDASETLDPRTRTEIADILASRPLDAEPPDVRSIEDAAARVAASQRDAQGEARVEREHARA